VNVIVTAMIVLENSEQNRRKTCFYCVYVIARESDRA